MAEAYEMRGCPVNGIEIVNVHEVIRQSRLGPAVKDKGQAQLAQSGMRWSCSVGVCRITASTRLLAASRR